MIDELMNRTNDDLKKDINTNLIVLMDVLRNFKDSGRTFNFISSWFVIFVVQTGVEKNRCIILIL